MSLEFHFFAETTQENDQFSIDDNDVTQSTSSTFEVQIPDPDSEKILVSKDEYLLLKLTNECYSRIAQVEVNRYLADKKLKIMKTKNTMRRQENKYENKQLFKYNYDYSKIRKQALSQSNYTSTEMEEFVGRYNGT